MGTGFGCGSGAGGDGGEGGMGSEQLVELSQTMVLPGNDLELFAMPSLLFSRSKMPTNPMKKLSPSTITLPALGIRPICNLQFVSFASFMKFANKFSKGISNLKLSLIPMLRLYFGKLASKSSHD